MSVSKLVTGRAPGLDSPATSLTRLLPAAGLAGSRGLAMFAQVAVQVAVGTLSGPVGLGFLQLFTAWSSMLGEVLARGWPSITLKRVSVAWARNERSAGRGALEQAFRAVIRGWPVGLAAGTAGFIILNLISQRMEGLEAMWMLPALLFAASIFALSRISAEAMKGADAPLKAITIENLIPPVTLLIVCIACMLLEVPLTPAVLVGGGLLGLIVGAVWIGRSVFLRLGQASKNITKPETLNELGQRRALWLSSVQGIVFLQLPFLLLPVFTDIETIGVYAVAHKLVNCITTLLILLASVFGPAFARAAASNDREMLASLLVKTQWLSTGLFTPAAIFLLVASDDIAGIFNVPSSGLYLFMGILTVGQLLNAITGLSGVLLNLSGAARTEWRISILILGSTLALAAPIGLSYGAIGLAVLFSFMLSLKNIVSWVAARRHLGKGNITL